MSLGSWPGDKQNTEGRDKGIKGKIIKCRAHAKEGLHAASQQLHLRAVEHQP